MVTPHIDLVGGSTAGQAQGLNGYRRRLPWAVGLTAAAMVWVAYASGWMTNMNVDDPGGYRLTVERQDVDALRFESLVAAARSLDPAQARPLLVEATALWRGAALGDASG